MVTTKRPKWVKPGQQWSAGETYEQYVAAGKPVSRTKIRRSQGKNTRYKSRNRGIVGFGFSGRGRRYKSSTSISSTPR